MIEQYHAPFHAAYTKLRDDLDRSTSDVECYHMPMFAVNFTLSPEGICATLLVCGTIPRPEHSTLPLTQLDREKAIEAATHDIEKVQTRRRIRFGQSHGHGPKDSEKTNSLSQLPSSPNVLVSCTTSNRWEGPHILINVDSEPPVIQTQRGTSGFRSACVKP